MLNKSKRGATLVEYGVIIGLIAIVSVRVVGLTGETTMESLDVASNSMAAVRNGSSLPTSGNPIVPDPSGPSVLPPGYTPVALALSNGFKSYADPNPSDNIDYVDVDNSGNYRVFSVAKMADMITGPANVTLSGHSSAQVVVNGVVSTTGGTITPGQSVELRMVPDAAFNTSRKASAYINGEEFVSFDILTRPDPDLTPDDYSFPSVTDVTAGSVVTSASQNIQGIEVNQAPGTTNPTTFVAPITIAGPGSPQFRVDGGSWVTSGNIANFQSIEVRQQASSTAGETHTAAITIGGLTRNFNVTTLSDTGLKFTIPAGDLGTVNLADVGQTVFNIPITSEVGNYGVETTPAGFSSANGQINLAQEGSGVVVKCYYDQDCVGTYTFDVKVTSYYPVVTATRTYTITLVNS